MTTYCGRRDARNLMVAGGRLALVLLLGTLAACSTVTRPPAGGSSVGTSSSRYEMQHDSPELVPIDLSAIRPVIPRVEPRTVAGNKSPYTINGVTYHVLPDETGYTEVGVASWYGRKFHGHLTSNGEVYDMFQVSAAHTRLPIPSYVRVTNLDNGKSLIARVNDRGPFHPGRIVDLSYAGAVLLGYADKGTARVRVEAVVPEQGRPGSVGAGTAATTYPVNSVEQLAVERRLIEENVGREYLQVGAFANLDSARALVARVSALTPLPVVIASEAGDSGAVLHKVRIGPLSERDEVQPLVDALVRAQLGRPFRVRI